MKTTFVVACLLLVSLCPALAAAQWVVPWGEGWLHAAVYHHATEQTFDADGHSVPFFADARAVSTSLFVTSAVGLGRGLDAWAQVSFHRLSYDDVIERTRTGPGDARLYLRAGPAMFGMPAWPIAVRGGVKLPGGDFPVDAQVIPLGEGQRDWEVMLEAGHSFYPRPVYAMAWAGYRWRETNTTAARTPGDEVFGYVAVGGQAGRWHGKLAAEAWRSAAPTVQGVRLPSAHRSMVQVLPTLGFTLGPGAFEVGGRVPVAGRNLPTGPAWTFGWFGRLSGW